jgi:small subunit ribosomal protein S4
LARYTGPRLRKMRAVGMHLPGLARKTFDRKPYPPGQQGAQGARTKKSEFGKQLIEKQKLRFNFGISENYLRRIYKQASTSREHTGMKLLELLERRLDNVIFRAGYAPSLSAARQLVRHNHVRVNGKKVNIPSVQIDVGDIVKLTDKAMKIPMVMECMENPSLATPPWLALESGNVEAKIITLPTREAFPFPIEIHSVVEYYSR